MIVFASDLEFFQQEKHNKKVRLLFCCIHLLLKMGIKVINHGNIAMFDLKFFAKLKLIFLLLAKIF